MRTIYKIATFVVCTLSLCTLFTGCQPQDLEFEHEKPQFETKANAILLEVIVPAGTSTKDQIYIVGEFNGQDTLFYENPDFVLTKAEKNDAKFGIYLYPEDFVEGKSLSDGFLFVSKQFGIENPATPHVIENAQLGERYTISITRWGGAAVTPIIEHDGHVLYVDNQTGWDALAVYAWGDEEIFGGWPGKLISDVEVVDGITYRYVDFGKANEGLSVHLIFNNNDGGTQLADYDFVINRDIRLRLTPDGVEEMAEHGSEFPDVEHDGDAVYLIDAAEWGAMALYMWGDVNDLNGGWPGMMPTGQFEFGGYPWYYFDLGAGNAGKTEHLIANNNGGGIQVDDIAVYELTNDSVLYFIVNPDKTVTQVFSPEEAISVLTSREPVVIEEATIDIYVLDSTHVLLTDPLLTDTTYTLSVYAWGSNEYFGGWPGKQVSEFEDASVLGIDLKHYRMDCKKNDSFNLIFNNSNNGRQLDGYEVKADEVSRSYYLKVTDNGVVPLMVTPLAPRR